MTKFNTDCVQAGYRPKSGEPRVLPLYQSTTFYYETAEEMAHLFDHPAEGHLYTRISNPTLAALEEKVTVLEGGAASLATSSGLAAETIAVLNVAGAGDNILSTSAIYGGSYNLFNVTLRKFGIDTRFFDLEADASSIETLIDENTKLIYAETIANPAMAIADFEKLSAIAKKHGLLFVVDNTLATPYLCRPFEHGANVVVHSTTKYFDGHAQGLGGMIVDAGTFDFKNNPRYADFNVPDPSYHGLTYAVDCGNLAYIFKARAQLMRDLGSAMSPFNAYLANLGLETLHLRMQRHSDNALAVATYLQQHPLVEWVNYPALSSDKNHTRYQKYFQNGASGMVTFGLKGDRAEAAAFMKKLKLIALVTHIADARSSALHPATTTHRQLSSEELQKAGVAENMIRLSIGIEDAQDLIADLKQAFN